MEKIWRNRSKYSCKIKGVLIILIGILIGFGVVEQLNASELPQLINHQRLSTPALNQVWSADQSGTGFLYFGTTGGLLEFDGAQWTKYPLPNGTIVRSVAVDQEGRIFVGGFEELGFWEYDAIEGLRYQSLTDLIPDDQLANEQIWNIILKEDAIFFQSFARIFKYQDGAIKVIYPPGNIMFGRLINGQLYVPSLDDGLFVLNDDESFQFVAGSRQFSQTKIELLLPLDEEQLLVGTKSDGLFLKKQGRFVSWNAKLNQELAEYQLNKGLQLSNGDIALGTVLNGVYVVDKTGRIKYHFNRKNGLQNNTILALKEDHLGNLWIGTDNGIDMILLRSPLRFFKDQLGEIGTVYTAAQQEDYLYLGTNQGVFYKKEKDATFQLIEGTQGQVWNLTLIGEHLLCGHNLGTLLIKKSKAEIISNITGGYCLLPVPGRPDLYIQGTYTGLVLFKIDAVAKPQLYKKIAGFNESAKYLAFDAEEALWVAHPNRGLFKVILDSDKENLRSYSEFTRADGLPIEYELRLLNYKNKILVQSGNTYLEYENNHKQFIPIQDAFFSDESDPFIFIMGGEDKYFKVFDNRVEYFSDAKLAYQLNITLVPGDPFILNQDSSYLFCIQNGYARLKPKKIHASDTTTSKTWIRSIVTPSRTIFLTPNKQETILLKPKERDIDIFFANTAYGRLKSYKVHLAGHEDQWHTLQNESFKRYTNLSGGTYQFLVHCGDQANEQAVVEFEVQLRWYETPWARIAFALAFIGIVYLFYRWHKYRLKQIGRQKEKQLQEERIKSNNELLKMELDSKRKELANSAMNLVKKNELLNDMRDKLQALRKEHRDIERSTAYKSLIKLVDQSRSSEQDLALFDESFEEIHDSFYKKLKEDYPDLTPGDLRLAAYLKMNLSSKEIAPLLNISVRGVENKRYRLRKKLDLSADENLTEFIMQL